MRLKSVNILTGFRGLKPNTSYRFDNVELLKDRLEPLCFVGVNGSGKSNVLEVVAEIFYYLDTYKGEVRNKSKKELRAPFGFEISYQMDINAEVSTRGGLINLQNRMLTSSSIADILVIKRPNELPKITIKIDGEAIIEESTNSEDFVLPVHVISYSSGENELISNPFIKSGYRYFEELTSKGSKSISEETSLSRLFHLDYDNAQLVTLCNFIFSEDNNVQLLKKAIEVKELDSFTIIIRFRNYRNNEIEFPQLLEQAISNLQDCASAFEEVTDKGNFRELRLSYIIDEDNEMKRAFKRKFGSALLLYRDLYLLNLMNIHQHKVRDRTRIKDIGGTDDNLSRLVPVPSQEDLVFQLGQMKFRKRKSQKLIKYKQLSDGEHQLMHVLGSIMLLNLSGSLLLFDEPETHFNPEWRSQLISLINEATKEKGGGGLREQEIIITSHSPFIVSDCRRERVFIFKEGKAENPHINTYGTSVNLITMNVFGKTETISNGPAELVRSLRRQLINKEITKDEAFELAEILGESIEKTLLIHSIKEMA